MSRPPAAPGQRWDGLEQDGNLGRRPLQASCLTPRISLRLRDRYNRRPMTLPVSRREFLITGGVVVAGTFVPDWTEAFQSAADDGLRAEVAEAALKQATALGASYADIRISRYRRES